MPATDSQLSIFSAALVTGLRSGLPVDELDTVVITSDQILSYFCTESCTTISFTSFGFIGDDNIYFTRGGSVFQNISNGYQSVIPVQAVEHHLAVRRIIRPGEIYLRNGSWGRRLGRRGQADESAG